MSKPNEQQLAKISKRYREAIKGNVTPKKVTINSPRLRRKFGHVYEISDSHLYFATVFAAGVLGQATTTPIVTDIEAVLTNALTQVSAQVASRRDEAAAAGIDIGRPLYAVTGGKNPNEIQSYASTRLSNVMLKIFLAADELEAYTDALWIEGLISDRERAACPDTMCAMAHKLYEMIQSGFSKLLNEKRKKFGEDDDAPAAAPSPVAAPDATLAAT